ncbi:unannotated protein [freshwater metagenome]|uniref:Unannotated protein n=1 Tax=freshwater metagenome TaxID=449393 RepID=A0A6J7F0Q4_9ZZZZ
MKSRRLLAMLTCAAVGLVAVPATSSSAGAAPAAIVTASGTAGNIVTIAGTLGSSGSDDTHLADPEAMAVDAAGNVYIGDASDCTIRKIDAGTGLISTIVGESGSCGHVDDTGVAARLGSITGLTLDGKGNLFVGGYYDCWIRKVDLATAAVTSVAGNGSCATSADDVTMDGGDNPIHGPWGVAFDSAGDMYIAEYSSHSIRKIDHVSHVLSTVAGTPGSFGATGDGGQATDALLGGPYGLAFDSADNMYITDDDNHNIRKVGTDGVITTVAGSSAGASGTAGQDVPATDALLYYPYGGVAFDAAGNMFIPDTYNSAIRKVDTAGVITTVAGTLGVSGAEGEDVAATDALLTYPAAVALDAAGNLFIVDFGTYTVREVFGVGAPALPAAPTITGITAGDHSLTVAFTPGADEFSTVDYYEYSVDDGVVTTTFAQTTPATTSSPMTITGLTNGTSYTVSIRAHNATGSSDASAGVVGIPGVAAPTTTMPEEVLLPVTGASSSGIVWLAAALLGTGVLLLAARRRVLPRR